MTPHKRIENIITDQSYTLIQQEIAFQSCINDLKPVTEGPDTGYYTQINKYTIAQGLLVGRQDKHNPMEKGFDKHYKIDTIAKIITIAKMEGVPVIIGHKFITMSREVEAQKLKAIHRNISTVKVQVNNGDATSSNIMYNNVAERDVTRHTTVAFDGDDHYSWFAMPIVVTAPNKYKLNTAISRIRAGLLRGGIRCEIPQFAQQDIIKAVIPSNQISANFLQPVNNHTIMSMFPLRNQDAGFPQEGPIFCTNAETLMPIKVCPTKRNPEGSIIIGPPGSGKTTMFLNIMSHALALGYHIKLIEPKNEDNDGTDFINFCTEYGGGVSVWGSNGVNPDPLIIFYDKTYMGTSPASYRKAKDDWFEVVQGIFSAWVGGLNERQSGILTGLLIDIYKKCGVIDEDGNPINTELWDVPGGIPWFSVHEFREYWKEQYNNKASDLYYHDASLDMLIMNTMNAEVGGTLWWWANSHELMTLGENLQLFDISQLPDRLRSAVSIQIMGACNSLYFPKPADGKPRVQTLLIFDEVRNLSQTPELVPYMERSLTEGRAPGITPLFGMQNPLKNIQFMDTLRANCKNLFILNNLDDMNIDIYMETFKIPERYRLSLMKKGSGHGLYIRNRMGTKFIVELDEMPRKAAFESTRGLDPIIPKVATEVGFEIIESARDIYINEEIFIDSWVNGIPKKTYPGFTEYRVQDPFASGRISAKIRTDRLKFIDGLTIDGNEKQDKVGVEGYKHYAAVCIIAGWMRIHGFEDVEIHHTDNADITWKGGCLEFEGYTNHTIDKWNEKLKAARAVGYEHIIFTGTGTTCGEMTSSEDCLLSGKTEQGEYNYVFPQGYKLLGKLEQIRDEMLAEKQNNQVENLAGFQQLSVETEA
jgi:hypothetical protein